MSRELLAKVLDYYEGRKPYDFYRLTDDFDRSNQAFDAWQEIAEEIRIALAGGARSAETRSKAQSEGRQSGPRRGATPNLQASEQERTKR